MTEDQKGLSDTYDGGINVRIPLAWERFCLTLLVSNVCDTP